MLILGGINSLIALALFVQGISRALAQPDMGIFIGGIIGTLCVSIAFGAAGFKMLRH